MNKVKLEELLGKEVVVIFKEGDTDSGILVKGDGYEKGYYQCVDSFWFRPSHAKSIREK